MSPVKNKLTGEDVAYIIRAYKTSNVTIADLSRAYGIAESTVRHHIAHAGAQRDKTIAQTTVAAIHAAGITGNESAAAIGKRLGISAVTVREHLDRAGINRRKNDGPFMRPALPDAWKAEALCAETDPEIFFPEKGGSTKRARDVCAECPVRAACLEYAIANREPDGVWGGLTPRKRQELIRGAA